MASEQYDVSAKDKRLVIERARMREVLRRQYIKEISNPHIQGRGHGGVIFDPAIQNFMAMRATHQDYFKANLKTSLLGFFGLIVPMSLFAYVLHRSRAAYERQCRNGEITYRDRPFKFV